MCGITGIVAFNEIGRVNTVNLMAATEILHHRGPDSQGVFDNGHVGIGHRRLAILDTTDAGNQPMYDATGRYVLAYNGEIYNFKELRQELIALGIEFRSDSDTEVLLNLYIKYQEDCLSRLNGFFAFAIYDQHLDELFIARDRIGIKPVLYLLDEDKFIFASEMSSIMAYRPVVEMDFDALYLYLQLNYVPGPLTMIKKVKKLQPGHYLTLKSGKLEIKRYYQIPYESTEPTQLSYSGQQIRLKELLEKSVDRRLISDVPLGAFLSGGIDSSILVGLASKATSHLNTFSIGYKDEPFFDETHYAEQVARHFGTEHTTFKLSNQDIFDNLYNILDHLDEPFADSSAIPVYILSRQARKHLTVALSGDGADELFGGYNKHRATYRAIAGGATVSLISKLNFLWEALPKSRNAPFSNKIRQLQRFASGLKLDPRERYWYWASLAKGSSAGNLLVDRNSTKAGQESEQIKNGYLDYLSDPNNLNDTLYTDMHLVLANDMLTKVDLMSMTNSLEIRVPFLDHEVVEFAFQLPSDSKVNGTMRKRILQDTFRELLPAQLYNRPKKGFEVPLLKWLRTDLKHLIDHDLLGDGFVKDQGIFRSNEIGNLKRQLFSSNPGDSHARIWALIVFQWWWKKYFS